MNNLMTVKEACAYAKMGRSRLYELLTSGEVSAVKRGHQTFVYQASIDAYNERHLEPWTPERKRGGMSGGTGDKRKPKTL